MGAAWLIPQTGPHSLHDSGRHWPLTSCYADLWIEFLHSGGYDPHPMLAFTARLAWEGDQVTFLKPDAHDIEILYGLQLLELALWRDLETHVVVQLRHRRAVLVEVDAMHLPDLGQSSYGREHTKTTIAILGLDRAARRCDYIHNATRATLSGADYEAVLLAPRSDGLPLPPYAEIVKPCGPPLGEAALTEAALARLRHHLAHRAGPSPVRAFRQAFPECLDTLMARPAEFHVWAFNTLRQLGGGFELLADFLLWLDARGRYGLAVSEGSARDLAATAKALQFRVARLVARGRREDCADLFDALEQAEAALLTELAARLG